jgi:hypothetical protein
LNRNGSDYLLHPGPAGCERAIHVTNQRMIFTRRPDVNSRMVGVYMLFYAVGSDGGVDFLDGNT